MENPAHMSIEDAQAVMAELHVAGIKSVSNRHDVIVGTDVVTRYSVSAILVDERSGVMCVSSRISTRVGFDAARIAKELKADLKSRKSASKKFCAAERGNQ